jgi:glutaredoxin
VEAEQTVAQALDRNRFQLEVVHLGRDKARIGEAERYGVRSVPALVIQGKAFHINFGASIEDLKK